MTLPLPDAAALSNADLAALLREDRLERLLHEDPAGFERLFGEVLAGGQQTAEAYERARQEWSILYYRPRNPMAEPVHYSRAREVAVSGGNRSSKTTTILAEMVIQATGIIPECLKAQYPADLIPKRFAGRVVGPSLTDWLEPVLLRKLRFTDWNGVGDPVDGQGHWGFIPRLLLKYGKWESSWREKTRTLHIARDSSHLTGGVLLELREWGSLQVMSNEMDLQSFAGPSLTSVFHDEIPRPDIYRENQLRTLDVKGRIYTAYTPPDEIETAMRDSAYFFETVYERGLPGPDKSPDVDTFELFTEANTILDPATIAAMAARLTPQQREVRFHGRHIHLTGVIFPSFAKSERRWCFRCHQPTVATGATCLTCHGDDTLVYCHVLDDFPIPRTWPVVMTADPHPRKPSVFSWFAIAPNDDVLHCGELAASAEAEGVKSVVRQVRDFEEARRWHVVKRLGDPNILTQTNDMMEKGWTMRQAFDREGLRFDLANDAMQLGITKTREMLAPDQRTRRPRLLFFREASRATVNSLSRWTWAEWKGTGGDGEPKEQVRQKEKDRADTVRYLCASEPTFAALQYGGQALRVAAGGRY